MWQVSMEDHIKDRNHSAKMRSLLFRQDLKSKRIKKIKSKTYHRLKKKDLMKSAVGGALMDPERAKEEAMIQEARRVEVSLKFPFPCTIFSSTLSKSNKLSYLCTLLCAYAGTYDVKAQKHRNMGQTHVKPWTECEIRWNSGSYS